MHIEEGKTKDKIDFGKLILNKFNKEIISEKKLWI